MQKDKFKERKNRLKERGKSITKSISDFLEQRRSNQDKDANDEQIAFKPRNCNKQLLIAIINIGYSGLLTETEM